MAVTAAIAAAAPAMEQVERTEAGKFAASAASLPFVAYVSNQAGVRRAPYTHTIADLKPIAHSMDALIYGQLQIDAETFGITSTMLDDADNYKAIVGLKAHEGAESMKVMFSVGGATVPSATWSAMAASASYRGAFINSAKTMIETFGFDGIELDWDYPCSPAKVIWVQLDAVDFRDIQDAGGTCPDDVTNVAELLKELRTELGQDAMITMTAGRNSEQLPGALITAVEPYVDTFMIKAYGYAVSADPATGGSAVTSPLQPIADLSEDKPGSVTTTISEYVKAGMPAEKMVIVIPAYGSTFYLPTAGRDEAWKKFGYAAAKSKACYGPYEDTYGAFPSDATRVCGEMTYSEIINAMAAEDAPQMLQDATTKTDMAFLPTKTTLVTFTGVTAVRSLIDLMQSLRLGGIAINSIDMDTLGATDHDDYHLTAAVCKAFFGETDRCKVATPTTTAAPPPPPISGGCAGHETGTYCANTTAFIFCPENVTESCPGGTVCKQNSTYAIICDWPDTHYVSEGSSWWSR